MAVTKVENSSIQLASAVNVRKIWGDIIYNVKAYGAKGDGVVDDYQAFAKATEAIPASGGVLFIPPGVYYISQRLSIQSKNLVIEGAGNKVSVLFFASGIGGIYYKSTDMSYCVTVRNLDIITLGIGTAGLNGLEIEFPSNQGSTWRNAIIENLIVQGSGSVADYYNNNGNLEPGYWTNGILCRNVAGLIINKVHMRGKFNGRVGVGIRLEGFTVDPKITDCFIDFMTPAIQKVGTLEGLHIENIVSIACGRLITIQNETPTHLTRGGVYGVIKGCHSGTTLGAISIQGYPQCFVSDNLLYYDGADANFQAIYLKDCGGSIVTNNHITAGGGADGWGILVDDTQSVNIIGNIINGVYFPIELKASAIQCIVTGNHLSKDVNNSGTDNLIVNNIVSTNPLKFKPTPTIHRATGLLTLAGGSASEVIQIGIPAGMFLAKPSVAFLTSTGNQIIGWYSFDHASNSATNAVFEISKRDGTVLAAGAQRFVWVMFE